MAKLLWITYAWLDNEEGDFDHLVNQLTSAGISVRYDKIALIPGRRLWEQIADQIANVEIGGWAYLVTPNSISSQPCREELEYALDRALRARGQEFPLIGLLHQVPILEVPTALRVRLCVNLRSPDWIEEVRAALEGRPPVREIQQTTDIKVRVHHTYRGKANLRAIEFLPRFGEIVNWRIAYPSDGPVPIRKGMGPANGGAVGGVLFTFIEGTVEVNNVPMKFFGAANALTPSIAAYVVFENELPRVLAFARSMEQEGIPSTWSPVILQ